MHLGFDIEKVATVHRYGALVRTYTRNSTEGGKLRRQDGTASLLDSPAINVANDKYMSSYGLVVFIGKTAFQDKDIFPYGPTFELGDLVAFDKLMAQRVDLNGIPFRIIIDEKIKMTIHELEAITFDEKPY